MHTRVLPPPSTPQWDILLVATLIYVALSIAYALISARLAGRLRTWPALFEGVPYGLAFYVANPYGIAVRLPRFAVARDWVTVVAHLISGVALAGGAGCLLRVPRNPRWKRHGVSRCTTAQPPVGVIDQAVPIREGTAGTRIEQALPERTAPELPAHECIHHFRAQARRR